jgi:hypothetical protein
LLIALIAAVVGLAAGGDTQFRAPTAPSVQPDDSTFVRGPVMDLASIAASSDFALVGRTVALTDVTIGAMGPSGFWATTAGAPDETFILPAEGSLITVRVADTVSLQGEVRRMSDAMRGRLNPLYARDEHIYVYAYIVRPAWPVGEDPPTGLSRRTGPSRTDRRSASLDSRLDRDRFPGSRPDVTSATFRQR